MDNTFYNDFDTAHYPKPLNAKDYRSPFQVDRDRVSFSSAFRRLQSKTQVFQSGEYDFYRTRLTHSIEVARIGRSICDFLNSNSSHLGPGFHIDPDLLEAICLAHDLGHPPFGHIGERKLNELMQPYGGFEGNAQTARILTELIYESQGEYYGMKPTRAFLDGVLKYKELFTERTTQNPGGEPCYPDNHFLYDDQASLRSFVLGDTVPTNKLNTIKSIECQIMDWADDTAYCLHDIVDGIRAGFLTQLQIEKWAEGQSLKPIQESAIEELFESIKKDDVQRRFSSKIGDFIQTCSLESQEPPFGLDTHRYRFRLEMSESTLLECTLYKRIAFDLIFQSPQLQRIEFKGGYILERIFDALFEHYITRTPSNRLHILPEKTTRWIDRADREASKARRICDYLADMTDRLATRTYKRLYNPEFASITDLH
ncbi:MAG TPA: deoxyguanosinetriphosphate triphosphohydrolase [Opitutae bacterium]|nr:deoxyguanosinetriphosphate triphosphohydrolase [Opitutae bacterium]